MFAIDISACKHQSNPCGCITLCLVIKDRSSRPALHVADLQCAGPAVFRSLNKMTLKSVLFCNFPVLAVAAYALHQTQAPKRWQAQQQGLSLAGDMSKVMERIQC